MQTLHRKGTEGQSTSHVDIMLYQPGHHAVTKERITITLILFKDVTHYPNNDKQSQSSGLAPSNWRQD